MKSRIAIMLCALALGSFVCVRGVGAEGPSAKKDATTSPVTHSYDADTMRLQGEQRYRANCGRCHAAPRKFPRV